MKTLDEHIAPDEPVLWRTPPRRDWTVAGAKLLAWTVGFPVAVAVLFQNPMLFVGSILVSLISLGFSAKYLLLVPTEALLTGRQLLFRHGIWRPDVRILERRDFHRAEIFDGDGTLFLYGRRGDLCLPGLLGAPLDLARAPDIPTTHWKPYEPPKRVWRVTMFTMLAFPTASVILMSALLLPLPEAFWEIVRASIPNQSRSAAVVVGLGIILAASIPSMLAAATLVGGIKRLLLPRDELNRMRCYKFYSRWRGENPAAAATGGVRAVLRTARLGFDRLINGPFPDCAGIEPEQYQPGAFPPPDDDEEESSDARV